MERHVQLSIRSVKLPELTFDESDMGDQLADIFDSVVNELGYRAEQDTQGGEGRLTLYNKNNEVVVVFYYDKLVERLQDIWYSSRSIKSVESKIMRYLK